METFYTIQGMSTTGKAAYCIRLGGCHNGSFLFVLILRIDVGYAVVIWLGAQLDLC